jgi:alpha-beta hydrolase superfamily lysophospholipase
MTAKYIAARLDTIDSDYPEGRIIVIAHSNGTVAVSKAMDMRYKANNWPAFSVDGLILLGSPMKRNYDWGNHPFTEVINFISKNDKVVWLARFYGMGAAGRYGFKKKRRNLKQVCVKWGHSGFMKQYRKVKCYVELLMEEATDGQGKGKEESKRT